MTLRAMTTADLAQITALESRCFSDAWNREAFESSLSVPFFSGLVLEENGEILAYACLSVVLEDAELLNIAVAPEQRKRGYGKTLLRAVLTQAQERGATACFLEVRKSNAPAIALYESFGFVAYGIRKKYYGDEDAVVMKKPL
jgi:ribosomal-protein-alanine N-acetyltransferase